MAREFFRILAEHGEKIQDYENAEQEELAKELEEKFSQVPDRDFSGGFANYEGYLKWFHTHWTDAFPLQQEQFYQSIRYSFYSRSYCNLQEQDRGKVLVISRSRQSSDFMEWSD